MRQPARYPIPAQTHRTEEEIRRSRFVTTLGYTPDLERARGFITNVNREFADANHNCWAYVVGSPGSTAHVGMSDAGEPHGTAGRPMLTVLLNSGVGDICAVVTRYFGGVLLGKGGLVRAYSGGVQTALATLPLAQHIPSTEVEVVIDYTAVTQFKRLLPDYEVELLEETYAADVTYKLRLPADVASAFASAASELTNGQILLSIIESDEEIDLSAGNDTLGQTDEPA
ncbi:MAG: YigZ family protein [Caldilineaceae bacterium]|nr:YigZ family protein [Caldilineaceae bacterium]